MLEGFSETAQKALKLSKALQQKISQGFQKLESNPLKSKRWQRAQGGGGTSKSLLNGRVFERAGVNHSAVWGTVSAQEQAMFQKLMQHCQPENTPTAQRFFATGMSLVMHPLNPFVPTVHANFRYFECQTDQGPLWWFGGGCDLTPYYLFDDDAKHFHKSWKKLCGSLRPDAYALFKQKCDRYFYLPHRQEHRGIGGIFFDYERAHSQTDYLDFGKKFGQHFCEAYYPLVEKRKAHPYLAQHKEWQQIRRGRYVEFNLLYDRGTLFGLKTGGRSESILMSLPPTVRYGESESFPPGPAEKKLLKVIRKAKNWA